MSHTTSKKSTHCIVSPWYRQCYDYGMPLSNTEIYISYPKNPPTLLPGRVWTCITQGCIYRSSKCRHFWGVFGFLGNSNVVLMSLTSVITSLLSPSTPTRWPTGISSWEVVDGMQGWSLRPVILFVHYVYVHYAQVCCLSSYCCNVKHIIDFKYVISRYRVVLFNP